MLDSERCSLTALETKWGSGLGGPDKSGHSPQKFKGRSCRFSMLGNEIWCIPRLFRKWPVAPSFASVTLVCPSLLILANRGRKNQLPSWVHWVHRLTVGQRPGRFAGEAWSKSSVSALHKPLLYAAGDRPVPAYIQYQGASQVIFEPPPLRRSPTREIYTAADRCFF
jgi:hypothetical protein